jgi:hypothetical protein
MKFTKIIALVLVALGALGCAETTRPTATGKGNIRGLNASVSTPPILFMLEERVIGTSDYKDSTLVRPFDDLDYIANFDYRFAGTINPARLISIPFKLVKDTDYLFIFTGSLDTPETLLWESPLRDWEGTETVLEVQFGHLSPQLGEVDMYFASPGTAPVLGEARATLTNGNHTVPIELPADDYEIILTAAGDPTDVLYTSEAIDYLPTIDYLIAVFDTDPSLNAPISVRAILGSGTSVELLDVGVQPALRAFHAAFATPNFDLFRDGDFSAPLIADVAFGEISSPVESVDIESTYTFTPANNSGATLHEEDFALIDGRQNSTFLAGEVGALATLTLVDNLRHFDDSAQLRIVHAAFNHERADIYVVFEGVDIETVPASFFGLPFLATTGYATFSENDYEAYVTTLGTKDIIAGPIAMSLAHGDIVQLVLIDTVDPALVDIFEFEHLSIAP